jgi:membrane protease YdiL (CAAX protease family)
MNPLMDSMPASASPPHDSPPEHWLDRLVALGEVAIVALFGSFVATGVFGALGASPLTDARHIVAYMWLEALTTTAVIWVLLKTRRRRLRNLGWTIDGAVREAALGVALVPGLFGVTFLIGGLFQWLCPPCVSETNPLLEMVRTRADLALFLMSSLFVGGFKEELQRAFVLTHFKEHLGGVWVGLLVWTVFFGALHSLQGLDKAVAAGGLGLVFGIVYILRGKVAAPMVAHALYDMTTLTVFWVAPHAFKG